MLVYTLVGSLTEGGPVPLTLVTFAAAVLVGLGYARWAARDERRPYRTPLAILVVAAALIGWLLPLGSDAAHLFDSPMAVLEMHPGGILLGLAVIRGTAHVKPDDDERIAEVALGPGLAGIAAIWAALTLSNGTHEPSTVDAAFTATVAFVTAGLLSMGLARLADLRDAGEVGADRRSWVGVLVGVLALMLAVAMPLALILGVPVDQAIRGALGPIGDVLAPIVSVLLLPFALLGAMFVTLINALQTGPSAQPEIPDIGTGLLDLGFVQGVGPSGAEAVILGLVPIVVAVVVLFLLVRRFLGQPVPGNDGHEILEIRETEGPTGGLRIHLPHLPAPRRRPVPQTASEAYLASLDVLAPLPDLARAESETPAEHARRLRTDPIGPTLGRLAADYSLAEFGHRTLAAAEHRRAVERWRRLRTMLER